MKNLIYNFPLFKPIFWFLKSVYYKFLNKGLIIGYNNQISNCHFGKHNVLGDFSTLQNSNLGDFTYVSANSHIRNASVGSFCSIGPSVKIGLGKHPVNEFISTNPLFYSDSKQLGIQWLKKSKFNEFEKVKIGNDVWIGANAVILDGVKINDGAIIAAGAVVNKDVEAYSIVGGVPAKHIKFRFSKEHIVRISQLKWWNLNEKELREKYVGKFIEDI